MAINTIAVDANALQPQPRYFCATCTKKCGITCTYFNRPVVEDYNRCFNHSNYNPSNNCYVEPINLAEILKREEERKRKLYGIIA